MMGMLSSERSVHVVSGGVSVMCCAQIQVQHPAAKSMIEISRTQDEEVGDGTTSVIILGKGILIYTIDGVVLLLFVSW